MGTGSDVAPDAVSQFSGQGGNKYLSQLPAELRNAIYQYVLTTDMSTSGHDKTLTLHLTPPHRVRPVIDEESRHASVLPLTQVCRQMRKDTHALIFGSHRIHYPLYCNDLPEYDFRATGQERNPSATFRFSLLAALPEECLNAITELTIVTNNVVYFVRELEIYGPSLTRVRSLTLKLAHPVRVVDDSELLGEVRGRLANALYGLEGLKEFELVPAAVRVRSSALLFSRLRVSRKLYHAMENAAAAWRVTRGFSPLADRLTSTKLQAELEKQCFQER